MSLIINSKSSSFLTLLAKSILMVTGWTAQINFPQVPKQVVIFAPHTSNWDFVFIISAIFSAGVRLNWIGKKELFWGPLNRFFRSLGGIPIDRAGKLNIVDQIVSYMDTQDNVIIGIAPEGTRSHAPYWKTGFYYIADNAKVPISFAHLDYQKKLATVEPGIDPTGDIGADFERIRAYFEPKTGKNPRKVGPVLLKPEG